ncbi:MAG: endolytic transglycosylase MltG [Candidatus Hydrogenedentes bacterium]|nr:endolytic transglycosylase MltG [Candidatus Hydrogenedentota bacterium]
MSANAAEDSRPKRSCLRILLRLFLFCVVLAVLLAAAAGFGVYLVYDHVTGKGSPGEPVRVEIPPGVTANQAGQVLTNAGLVDHELLFRIAVRLDTVKKPIQQGFYDVPQGLSPTEILRMLQEGPNVADARFKVTVAEGQTIKQTAKQFKEPDAFIAAASDTALIQSLGIQASTLEGFLMPDTYFFDEEPAPEDVVARMVEHFEKEYAALMAEIPGASERNKFEVVTVASLVEEESRVNDERPIVAAVIYNRIKANMTLDFDSTLQFALDKYGQRLLNSDKEIDSPYNSYRIAGLPPGPISSPGVDSLRAALQPARVEYLYFVSNADGKTHTFSTTLEEHNKAVTQFRREIAIQRKEQEAHAAQESEQ